MKKRPSVLHLIRQEHLDKDGNVLWESDEVIDNLLTDEGEQAILSAYFDTDLAGYGAPGANHYIGLTSSTITETSTLTSVDGAGADIVEPTTGGYARQAVLTTTGFTLSQPGTYYKAACSVSWTATATYATVDKAFLCTVSSGTAGKLIAAIALSQSRTLANGDILNLTFSVGLSE